MPTFTGLAFHRTEREPPLKTARENSETGISKSCKSFQSMLRKFAIGNTCLLVAVPWNTRRVEFSFAPDRFHTWRTVRLSCFRRSSIRS